MPLEPEMTPRVALSDRVALEPQMAVPPALREVVRLWLAQLVAVSPADLLPVRWLAAGSAGRSQRAGRSCWVVLVRAIVER